MGIVVDLLLVCLYAFLVFLAAKKGFVVTLIDLVGGLLAFVIALKLSGPIANVLYDGYVQERMVALLLEKLPAGVTNPQTVFDPQLFLDLLPASVAALAAQLNLFNGNSIAATIGKTVNVNTIEQKIIAPVATLMIRMLCLVVIALVLLIAVKFVARVLSKLIKHTPLKSLNTALGGALGALRGLLTLAIVCVALVFAATLMDESALAKAVETSRICTVVSSLLFQ